MVIVIMLMVMMLSARTRSGQERILEAYHHLHRQALGLPSLLPLVARVGCPPMGFRGRDRGGATGGPTISRPKAVGRTTALIVSDCLQYLSEHYHHYRRYRGIVP